jgi:hypothetical protein
MATATTVKKAELASAQAHSGFRMLVRSTPESRTLLGGDRIRGRATDPPASRLVSDHDERKFVRQSQHDGENGQRDAPRQIPASWANRSAPRADASMPDGACGTPRRAPCASHDGAPLLFRVPPLELVCIGILGLLSDRNIALCISGHHNVPAPWEQHRRLRLICGATAPAVVFR